MFVRTPSTRSRIAAWSWALLALGCGLAAWLAWIRLGSPPEPDQVWDQAQAALRAGRFSEAHDHLEQVSRLRSPTDRDWMLRAQIALAEDHQDQALAALAHIESASPLAPQALLLKGQIELRRNRFRAAEAALLEAVALDPNLIPARRELVYIYGCQTRRQALGEQMRFLAEAEPPRFSHLFLWCLTRGSIWDAREIITMMSRNIAADPDDKWSRLALADSLANQDRLAEAEAALAPIAASDPDALAMRARIAIDRGDLAGAQELLQAGATEHAALAQLRGRLALLRRDGAAALREFRIADRIEPNSRDTIHGLAQAYRLLNDPANASRYADLAKKHDHVLTLMQHAATEEGERDPSLPMRLGAAHEAIGRLAEARAWYQLAVDRNPLDPAAQQALNRLPRDDKPSP